MLLGEGSVKDYHHQRRNLFLKGLLQAIQGLRRWSDVDEWGHSLLSDRSGKTRRGTHHGDRRRRGSARHILDIDQPTFLDSLWMGAGFRFRLCGLGLYCAYLVHDDNKLNLRVSARANLLVTALGMPWLAQAWAAKVRDSDFLSDKFYFPGQVINSTVVCC